MNSFAVVAWGPGDVRDEVRAFVQHCVEVSALNAYHAFQAAPSPELGARVAAAWATFHGTLPGCLSMKGLAQAYVAKFELGYIQRGRWVPGLRLKFTAENPSARLYGQLHDQVKSRLPDPVNKVIQFYIASQQLPNVDIRVDPPPGVRRVLSQMPDPTKLRHYVDDAEAAARRAGKQLQDAVVRDARETATRAGEDVARAGMRAALAPVQLAGQAADAARRQAPKFDQPILPKRNDDGSVTVPIVPGLPGPTVTVPPLPHIPTPNIPIPHIPTPDIPVPHLPSIRSPF